MMQANIAAISKMIKARPTQIFHSTSNKMKRLNNKKVCENVQLRLAANIETDLLHRQNVTNLNRVRAHHVDTSPSLEKAHQRNRFDQGLEHQHKMSKRLETHCSQNQHLVARQRHPKQWKLIKQVDNFIQVIEMLNCHV